MNIVRWNPFRELEDMQTRWNRFFNGALPRPGEEEAVFFADWAPPVPMHAEARPAVWERTGSRPDGLRPDEVAQRRTAAVRTEPGTGAHPRRSRRP